MSEVMRTGEARERIDRVRALVNAAWDDLIALYQQRAWESLGYDNWDDMCAAEFQGARIALPRDDRREVVSQLHDQGMSTRAIGSALGVSHDTVHKDLAGVRNLTPETEPKPVTGLDGKTYTAPPKRAPVTYINAPDPIADEEVESLVQDFIAGGPEVRAAQDRHRFAKWLAAIHQHHQIDPERMADLAADRATEVETTLRDFTAWVQAFREHINQAHTLRVIPGESIR